MGRKNDGRKGDRWSYSAGRPPNTARVFERENGIIYAAKWNAEEGREEKWSLEHSDREKAKDFAEDLAIELRDAEDDAPPQEEPTVSRTFKLYRQHRVPDKSERVQEGDDRRLNRWKRFLGPDFDLAKLSRREWDDFKRKRASGAIDAKGNPVPQKKDRREVSTRTVEKDLRFLRSVCRWAMDFRDRGDRLLLERDPTRGLEIPKEKNPNRPTATHDRVDAIREHYRKPTMRLERGGEREKVESYLPEVFEIVVGTGRRIGAVRQLRREDLDLERTARTPHGAIVWPSDTDKMGKEWRCPISKRVREALESALRKRRRVGPGPLFPSPGDPEKPLRYEEVSAWLRDVEKKAGVEPHDGSLWHAYRRLWATARKELPDVDAAQAGGWSSLEALQQAYQQPDDATMLRVVEHEAELREVR